MLERAGAVTNGQVEEFEKNGIEGGKGQPGKQYFNTNIAFLNYTLLASILQEILEKVFKDDVGKLQEKFASDLISGLKTGPDGEKYVQIEGPIGTCFINLHNFCEDNQTAKGILNDHGVDKLLRFVNLSEPADRTKFFTPIKLIFDYILQADSDFYNLNTETWMMENVDPQKVPPYIEFRGIPFYNDLTNCEKAFGKFSIMELKSLVIKGAREVFFTKSSSEDHVKFIGDIKINNKASESVNLNDILSRYFDKNGNRIKPEDIRPTGIQDNIEAFIDEGSYYILGLALII
jgi:hypothetical protein